MSTDGIPQEGSPVEAISKLDKSLKAEGIIENRHFRLNDSPNDTDSPKSLYYPENLIGELKKEGVQFDEINPRLQDEITRSLSREFVRDPNGFVRIMKGDGVNGAKDYLDESHLKDSIKRGVMDVCLKNPENNWHDRLYPFNLRMRGESVYTAGQLESAYKAVVPETAIEITKVVCKDVENRFSLHGVRGEKIGIEMDDIPNVLNTLGLSNDESTVKAVTDEIDLTVERIKSGNTIDYDAHIKEAAVTLRDRVVENINKQKETK